METSAGTINLKLYNDRAPDTVANFVNLVQQGYYDGLHFHELFKLSCSKQDALILSTQTQTAGTGGPKGGGKYTTSEGKTITRSRGGRFRAS